MQTKYAYVSLSGGLNDRMSNIYRAYKYCCRMKRTLLVDFKTTEFSTSRDYKINLFNILSFKQNDIICDSDIIASILNENKSELIKVNTPVYKLHTIKNDWSNKIIVVLGRGFCNQVKKNKEKERRGEENQKLYPSLVYNFFFNSIKLNQNIKKYCKKKFKTLTENYSVIQIRNTDRSTNYIDFFSKHTKNYCKTIYVATDSKLVLENLNRKFTSFKFINFTEFPDKDLPLHKCNLDGVTKLRDLFLDLYICSRATNFFSNSPGRFSLLCKYVQQNKTKIG
jgi:hypothetical protein